MITELELPRAWCPRCSDVVWISDDAGGFLDHPMGSDCDGHGRPYVITGSAIMIVDGRTKAVFETEIAQGPVAPDGRSDELGDYEGE